MNPKRKLVYDKEEYNIVYARVSSSEQAKTNLEYQSNRVCKFVNANGKVVHRVPDYMVRGELRERPRR